MCEPATIIAISAAALSAASGIGQGISAKKTAEAQRDYAMRAGERNASQVASALNLRQAQQNVAATQEKSERALQAMRDRSKAIVAAGEAGVAGVSPEMIQKTIMGQGYSDISTLESNRIAAVQQSQLQKEQTYSNMYSNANIAIPSVDFIGPLASAGLQIGGAYGDYKTQKLLKEKGIE